MPDIYEIKDPRDGSVFELQLDHPPTPEEARTAVAKYRVSAAKSAGKPMMGADPDAGPMSGLRQVYRKAFPPTPERVDSNIATVGGVGIAPEDAMIGGLAGRAIAGAARAGGGVLGMAKEAVVQASPIVKYEAVRSGLHSAGVPDSVAIPIAMVVSGYQRGAKPGAPESPVSVPAPNVPTAGTPVPPRPTGRSARATPPAARTTTPVDPAMEEIGDRMAGGPNRPSPGNGSPAFDLNSLTPQEKIQALKWYEGGMTPEKILENIGISRKLTGRLNTPNPEEAAVATKARVAEAAKRRKGGIPDEEPE